MYGPHQELSHLVTMDQHLHAQSSKQHPGDQCAKLHPIIKSVLAARSQRRAWQTLLAQATHAQIKKDCIALRNTAAGIAICTSRTLQSTSSRKRGTRPSRSWKIVAQQSISSKRHTNEAGMQSCKGQRGTRLGDSMCRHMRKKLVGGRLEKEKIGARRIHLRSCPGPIQRLIRRSL